jgi:hypothetical protein
LHHRQTHISIPRTHVLTYGGEDDLLNSDLDIFCDAHWASDAPTKSLLAAMGRYWLAAPFPEVLSTDEA